MMLSASSESIILLAGVAESMMLVAQQAVLAYLSSLLSLPSARGLLSLLLPMAYSSLLVVMSTSLAYSIQFATRNRKNTLPIHSTLAAHPVHHPSYCCHQLLVDCCVLQPNGCHLRPRTHPLLYFLMHLHSASQPREPAAARANPSPGACNRLMGSRSNMIWGHGRCCHGDIGKSRWG
jgi:hypothetical protein